MCSYVCLFFLASPQARALLQTASSLAPHMYEPHFNFATVSDKVFSSFINLSSDTFLIFLGLKKYRLNIF